MESEAPAMVEHALLGLAIMTAIPVVAYALWGEYFKMRLEALKAEGEKIDESIEIYRIRSSSMVATVVQVLTFLTTQPIREVYPVAGFLLPVSGLLLQGIIRAQLEKRFESENKGEATAGDLLRSSSGSFFWAVIGSISYLACVFVFLSLGYFIPLLLKAPPGVILAFSVFGMFLGLIAGIAVNFALGPLFLRKMLPTVQLTDSSVLALVEEGFAKAGLQAPTTWVIELGMPRAAGAMTAGFIKGKGWFAPGLFLSESMIKGLSRDELYAVICHEVSHLKLSHLAKRFLMTVVLSLSVCISSAVAAAIALWMMPPEMRGQPGGVGLLVAVGAFLVMMLVLRHQNFSQEKEADLHAVNHLGAKPEALISALVRIDSINGEIVGDVSRVGPFRSHPSTQERVYLLSALVSKDSVEDSAGSSAARPEDNQGERGKKDAA